MSRIIATAADAGRSCPYCRFPLKEGAAAERCDSCDSLHHEDCWRDGGGCAVLGCAQAGTAAAAPAAAGPPAGWAGPDYHPGGPAPSHSPPTQMYPGYGPSGYPPPQPVPASPPRSGGQAVLVVAVIIALLGIGTGVAVATGAFSKGARTTNTPATSTTGNTGSTTSQTPTAPAGPTPSEQASDRHAVMGLLSVYQSAYSDHNLSGLSNLFTPEITRHGLAAGGCTVSRGRNAVLADYQSQFEEGSGSYELVGLAEGEIRLDGRTQAYLHAHYQIAPGGSGYVNFKFAELGEGWKISEVYATCE